MNQASVVRNNLVEVEVITIAPGRSVRTRYSYALNTTGDVVRLDINGTEIVLERRAAATAGHRNRKGRGLGNARQSFPGSVQIPEVNGYLKDSCEPRRDYGHVEASQEIPSRGRAVICYPCLSDRDACSFIAVSGIAHR